MNMDLPAEFRSIAVRDYTKYVSAWCPFDTHKAPALLIYKDGFFRCLSCGRRGTWDLLAAEMAGGRRASPSRHLPRPYLAPTLPSSPEDLESYVDVTHQLLMEHPSSYLIERGLAGRVKPRRLGADIGWIVVPAINRFGVVRGVVLRSVPSVQERSGLRFMQPKDQKPMVYIPDHALYERSSFLFVTFGIFDALTLDELGYPVATSTGGKLSFDPAWVANYRRPVILLPDADEEPAMVPYLRELGWMGRMLRLKYPPGKKDPNGFFEAGRPDLLTEQLDRYLREERLK